MIYKSLYPDLQIPRANILSHLFGNEPASEEPRWLDCKDPNNNLSPAQLLRWVRRLGFGLERLGLTRGDVVMICTPNHVFVPVAYLGTVGAGCIFTGANPAYTEPELVHQITNTRAKVILANPKMLTLVVRAADKAGVPKGRIFQFSDKHNPVRDGIWDWTTILGTPDQGESWKWADFSGRAAANTIATINYSSGTTGLPKGVCVSHFNLIANLEQTIFMRYVNKPSTSAERPPERWIGFLPLYHAYGQLWTILMATKLNVPIYIMEEFRYEDFLFTIERYRITSLQVAPPILVMLSKRPETARHDISSVRDVVCGAAPLSQGMQNECQRRFGFQINQGWGMTEVTCGALHVPGGIMDNSGSVGQLDPNCECRLVDEEGRDVATGQPGEIILRGPNVCMCYWRNEEATKDSLDEQGWLKTGDIATCDDKGYFWIVDRKKELIKVNAFQVAPAELEAALLENDHVADAAVVGITLEEQEWPRGYVVIQEASKGKVTPDEIKSWLSERVAKHKRLAGGLVFVNEVPRLVSGKIQRKVMRQWAKRDAVEIKEQKQSVKMKL